jgi:hypothetical protein
VRELELFDVQLRLNGSNHNDILIRLGNREVVGDTYYLALDNAYRPDESSEEKVQELFARLLATCAAKVEGLEDGESAYLPFDFQDEWLGCVRCLRRGSEFSLVLGKLDENGYAVSPSEPSEVFSATCAFRPTGDNIQVQRDSFLSRLSGLAMSAAAQVKKP